MRRHLPTVLLSALLAPTLMGASCDPDVDLGGNPDAGPAPVDAHTPDEDAGSTAPDAGEPPADAGPPFEGEVHARATEMLIDVTDGSASALSLEIGARVDDPGDATHDVRAVRFELLDGSGAVAFTFDLEGTPMTRGDRDPGTGHQTYASGHLQVFAGSVADFMTDACASDAFRDRLFYRPVRVVVSVDGAEHATEQELPPGTGGSPPMRPFVLCHEGVRVERPIESFGDGLAYFRLRPDGTYDADVWESVGTTDYVAAPLVTVDPTVHVSPAMGRHYPSLFPPFDVTMDSYGCAGCDLYDGLIRYVAGASTPPMQISADKHWCPEPEAGYEHFGVSWPPSEEPRDVFPCHATVTSPSPVQGDGAGIARTTGTTTDGPFAVEIFVRGGSWTYGPSSH
ncbi:MAG TPA: hypothetical protein RMH99_01845 [Sandaracinaceae bacterium LLY-WYZ-13_1]|nr:hypothetical protein [Sandaracinaceae bacterium LLY-WYZ-13_1]